MCLSVSKNITIWTSVQVYQVICGTWFPRCFFCYCCAASCRGLTPVGSSAPRSRSLTPPPSGKRERIGRAKVWKLVSWHKDNLIIKKNRGKRKQQKGGGGSTSKKNKWCKKPQLLTTSWSVPRQSLSDGSHSVHFLLL